MLECANLFSPNEYKKNDKIIDSKKVKMKKFIALFVINIENLNYLKYHCFLKNITSFYWLP